MNPRLRRVIEERIASERDIRQKEIERTRAAVLGKNPLNCGTLRAD